MDYATFIALLPTYLDRARTHPDAIRMAANSVSRAAMWDVRGGVLSLSQAMRLYTALNAVYQMLGDRPPEFRNFVAATKQRGQTQRRRRRLPR